MRGGTTSQTQEKFAPPEQFEECGTISSLGNAVIVGRVWAGRPAAPASALVRKKKDFYGCAIFVPSLLLMRQNAHYIKQLRRTD